MKWCDKNLSFYVFLLNFLLLHISLSSMWTAKQRIAEISESLNGVSQTIENTKESVNGICDLVASVQKGVENYVNAKYIEKSQWHELSASVSKMSAFKLKELAKRYIDAVCRTSSEEKKYDDVLKEFYKWVTLVENSSTAEEAYHNIYLLGGYLKSCGMPEEALSRVTVIFEEINLACRRDKLIKVLNKGIALDTRDYRGRSIAHYAAEQGDLRLLSEILRLGLPVNSTIDAKGLSILHVAARVGNSSLIRGLTNGFDIDINCRAHDGTTPLHEAVISGKADAVKTLLECGAKVDIQSISNECTPLHIAASVGQEDMVKMLIEHGASLDIRSKGKSALHFAAEAGQFHIVKMLVQGFFANINDPCTDGRTIYHLVASIFPHEMKKHADEFGVKKKNQEEGVSGRAAIAEAPLIEGAKNKSSNDMREASSYTSISKFPDLLGLCNSIDFLMKQDQNGSTALHLATEKKNEDNCAALIEKALTLGNSEVVARLLRIKDNNGFTAFHVAVECGYASLVELYVREMLNIPDFSSIDESFMNAHDNSKRAITDTELTPFEVALYSVREHIIKQLKEKLYKDEKIADEGVPAKFRFMNRDRGIKLLQFAAKTGKALAAKFALDYFKVKNNITAELLQEIVSNTQHSSVSGQLVTFGWQAPIEKPQLEAKDLGTPSYTGQLVSLMKAYLPSPQKTQLVLGYLALIVPLSQIVFNNQLSHQTVQSIFLGLIAVLLWVNMNPAQ